MFKQIDSRPNFVPINKGLASHSSRSVWDTKKIGEKIYIATSDGIYELNSSETAWESRYRGKQVRKIAGNSNNKIWAILFDKILRSDDGINWQIHPTLPTGNQFWDLIVSQNNDIYIVDAQKGLFQSKDQGSTWTLIGDQCNRQTTIDDNGNLYCLSYTQGVSTIDLLKREAGQSVWRKINDVGFMGGIAWKFGTLIVSKSVPSLAFSRDSGKSFFQLNSGALGAISVANAFWDINQFYFLSATRVLVPSDNGLVEVDISTEPYHIAKKYNLDNYTETYSFTLAGNTSSLQSRPNFLLGFQDHMAVVSSGPKWSDYFGSEVSVFDSPLDDSSLHVQSDWLMGGIVRLVDYPNKEILLDRTCIPTPLTAVSTAGFDNQSRPKIAYVACNNSKSLLSFRMTTNPAGLEKKSISTPGTPFVIAVDPTNGIRMAVLTSERELYLSSDRGAKWSKLSWPTVNVKSISFNPFDTDELMITILVGTYSGAPTHNISFYKISQQAITSYADPDKPGIDGGFHFSATYDPFEKGLIYAGGENGFFFSEDSGKTWTSNNEGLYGFEVRKIIPTQHRIYIGVWGSGIATISKAALLTNRTLIPCTFTYSDWGACDVSGQEARDVLSSLPDNCNSSLPVTSRTCVFLCPSGKLWDRDSCKSPSAFGFSSSDSIYLGNSTTSAPFKNTEGVVFDFKKKKHELRQIRDEYRKDAVEGI
ncbi:MAG: hypothetical protein IPK68_01030 [Bdellovibrionales bacterium]|nr:hypothetical protein [Bdellovibrionales bacterium]